jgi:hypothetical protein
MTKLVLWTLLWLLMCLWGIIGSVFVVLAVVSFFVDVSPVAKMSLFNGEPVRTPQQKAVFLAIGLALAVVGLGFVWLNRRGYVKGPL